MSEFRLPTKRERDGDGEMDALALAGDSKIRRLSGTSGEFAAVGEVLNAENGVACWKLHPNYATWFWPLMNPVNNLVLQLPESMLEPVQEEDSQSPPVPPSDEKKRAILKLAERQADCARVYSLAMRGKSALVHKGFPTRVANLAILRRYRKV